MKKNLNFSSVSYSALVSSTDISSSATSVETTPMASTDGTLLQNLLLCLLRLSTRLKVSKLKRNLHLKLLKFLLPEYLIHMSPYCKFLHTCTCQLENGDVQRCDRDRQDALLFVNHLQSIPNALLIPIIDGSFKKERNPTSIAFVHPAV